MSDVTEEGWEQQLRRRAATVRRAVEALDESVAAARLRGGLSFREIGNAAEINHERARTIATRINGHTKTQAALDAEQP
ncbi:hypothetical protein ACFWPV_10015 [Streptomyces uncialis]|uniref:hypothetical protein n=1 Tax=Streptomyces uncialis TaxID=1048205 RepID=UPI00365C93DD